MLIRLGADDRGLEVMSGAVKAGYTPVSTLSRNAAFDRVRDLAAFKAIEDEALRHMMSAQAVFEREGGPEMLGMPDVTRFGN